MPEKTKHSRLVFHEDNDVVRIDINQTFYGRRLNGFAINVAVVIDNGIHDVFRVDTAHGYLHTQRFWVSNKPEPQQTTKKKDYKGDFAYWKNKVMKEYKEYVRLYKKKIRW